ncbi:MAG: PfkB family carbohydrate kinase [Tannerellaceae bacterium]
MTKYDLCCVGHITLDKVITPKKTVDMPGGTAFYFSSAIKNLNPIQYKLATALATSEIEIANKLQEEGIDVLVMPSKKTLCFENIYGENQDNRTQRVTAKADPFTVEFLKDLDAGIFHLGSLMADDFSLDLVKFMASKGKVSVDSQGYLREVRDEQVFAVDWTDKLEAMKHIHFMKANEHEMEVLTGYDDIRKAATCLHEWGIKEVLITLGSLGSVIYDGKEFYRIPAYKPSEVVDATGCGDTYMCGYLYKRAQGATPEEAGHYAAAMSTIKIQKSGPFDGTEEDILNCMKNCEQRLPEL